MKHLILAGLAAGAFVAVAGSASASLLGANVTSQYYAYGGPYNGQNSPVSFVANGTVQQTFCAGCIEGYNLTVSGNQITYEFLYNNGYWSPSSVSYSSGGITISNGNLLTFGNRTITGVTLDAATNMPGFTAANFGFDAHDIGVDWANFTGISAGDKVVLDVTSIGGGAPEPASWAIMILGTALTGAALRRSRATSLA